MVLAMMAIHLAQTLVASHSSNRVLDLDPPPRKCTVEADIISWAWFATWFAPRAGAQALWMQCGDANIGQITDATDPSRQPLHQLRLLEQRQVGSRSDHTLGHVANLTCIFIDRDLTL